MPDAHKNFAYSTVSVAPSPATTGTTLTVTDGSLFPAAPFNCTVWPTGVQPTYTGVTATTAEIVRVTSKGSGNDWTIVRLTEDAAQTARTIVVGDQIAASLTKKTFTDIEESYANTWSPYFVQTGTGVATYASTAASVTGSVFLFPVELPYPVRFNQILVPNYLTFITTSNTSVARDTYYSYFGLYTLNSNTLFSLITSNSFRIEQTAASVSMSWNFPTTTHTTGYGYGSLAGTGVSAVAQRQSLVDGSRVVGLQFGTELSFSGGQYWLGVMQVRSTSSALSAIGLSHSGLIGQIVNPINMMDTRSGMMPIGYPMGLFTNSAFSNTGWFGRHLMGLLQNTIVPNFGGTKLPNNITLSQLVSPTVIATVLPNVTLVST